MGRPSKLRAAVLLACGALVVHKLRFVLGYPEDPDGALAYQGHQYLSFVTPLIVGAVAIALGHFLTRLCTVDRRPIHTRPQPGLVRLWVSSSGCLIALYTAQELCEGLLSSTHPSGLAGVFGNGGWIAVLAALAVGAVIAVAVADDSVCIYYTSPAVANLGTRLSVLVVPPPMPALSVRDKPLACNLASRAPPATGLSPSSA
jgi:hypothetical protein